MKKIRVAIDGKTYEVEYDTSDGEAPRSSGSVERAQSIVLPTPALPDSSGTAGVEESKLCRSPVAGIVAKIRVEAGQSVKAGDTIVVVDAMKMENNLTALTAAKVKAVKVKVGETVKLNQIVVEFE